MTRCCAALGAIVLVGVVTGCGRETTYDASDVQLALTKAGLTTHVVFNQSTKPPESGFDMAAGSLEDVMWRGLLAGTHIRALVAGPERAVGQNVPERYAVMAWVLPSWQEAVAWRRARGGISRENVVIDAAKPLRSRVEAAIANIKDGA